MTTPTRLVLLFSGHMVDAPGRPTPRFTPAMVPAAQARIEAVLDQLGAGPQDLALSQAAAGGDLLFLQACVARGVRCQVLLPEPEPAFLAASVLPSLDGERWLACWQSLRPRLAGEPQVVAADTPGAVTTNIYERCNQRLLATALAAAVPPTALHLLLLWNGGGGDGPGGTRHMMTLAEQQGAQVHWIDTRSL